MNNVFNDFLMLANIQFVENVSVLVGWFVCTRVLCSQAAVYFATTVEYSL